MKQTLPIFKKWMLALLIPLLLLGSASAQTVTIGTGTLSSYFYGPIYRSSATSTFHQSKYAYLYTAAELAAAGIVPGSNITDLAWARNSTFGMAGASSGTMTIYMANTSNTALTTGTTWGTFMGSATLVKTVTYNTTSNLPAATGFYNINLSTPMLYTGGALEIYVDWVLTPGASPFAGGAFNWLYASGMPAVYTLGAAGSGLSNATALSSVTYGGTLRPNIQLTYVAATACSGTPAGGTASANSIPTATSVCPSSNVSFSVTGGTSASGLTYQWEYSATGGAGTYSAISGAVSSAYTLSGFSSGNVGYYRRVETCTASGLSAPSVAVNVTLSPFINCYCSSIPTQVGDEEIYSVTVNGGSTNATYVNGCTVAAPGPGSILNRYSNFTTLPAISSVAQGATVPFSIVQDECDGATYYANGIGIWIDFNQNGSFLDAGEAVFIEATTGTGPRTVTGNITIPVGAIAGNTVMRVISAEGYSGATLTPCLAYGYGETEDHLVTIVAATNCSGTPAAANTVASAASVCPSAPVNLSLSTIYSATGITYQWQANTGSGYSNITGANSSTYTATQSVATSYQCIITCTFSGQSVTSTPVSVGMNSFMNCYCSSVPTQAGDEEIYSVTVNGGSTNATYVNGCTVAAPGPGSILNRYSNFTTLPAISSVAQGATVPFSIVQDECDGATYYANGIGIWIDFNQNGSFLDAGEAVFIEATTGTGPRTVTGNITIPVGAIAGNTVMRVISAEGYSGATLTPCLAYGYGETEDHVINIVAATACTGTPATTATASPTSFCASGTSTLTVTGAMGTGITYQWQSSPDGTTGWANVIGGTGGTTSAYTTPTLTSTTYYRCFVTCTNSGLSANSTVASVTINPAPTGNTFATPIVVGTIPCAAAPYVNTQTNTTANCWSSDYTGANAQASPDIFYQFTLPSQATVQVGHCGSAFDTYIHLLNSTGTQLFSNDDFGPVCPGATTGSIETDLAAGTYYVVSEGYGAGTGAITTTINVKTPTVSATPSAQTISTCTATGIALTGGYAGTTFNWTASLQSGSATGFSAGSGATIAQTLSNTGTTNAVVRYTITPSAGGCTGTPLNVDITILAPNAGAAQTTCGTTPVTMTPVGTGTWSGGAGSWAGNTYTPTTGEAGTALTVTFTVCAGSSATSTITVVAPTTADAGADKSTCGTTTVTMTPIGTGTWSGGAGTWSGNNYTPTAAEAGTTVTATFTVTGTAPCTNATDMADITVGGFSTSIAPTNGTDWIADYEITDAAGWTSYYDDNGTATNQCDDYLLLSLKKNGNTIGTVGDGTFEVKVAGAAGSTAITYNNNYVQSPIWNVMNRYWLVTPNPQPTSDVGVKFYYTTPDFTAILNSSSSVTQHTEMNFFKINGAAYNPDPTLGHVGIPAATAYNTNGYWQYMNGAAASTADWAYSAVGSEHAAEYVIGSFSGGGGGGGGGGGAFPVEIADFKGVNNININYLTWNTLTESNNKEFVLMRSNDNVVFENLTTVSSKALDGNSQSLLYYSFTDNSPFEVSYYRLKQIDIDGAEHLFSQTIELRANSAQNLFALYPNPTADILNVQITSPVTTEYKIEVFDLMGKLVLSEETATNGLSISKLNVANLAKGSYVVSISSKTEGKVHTTRFVKE